MIDIDKDWLYHQLFVDVKKTEEIAKILGCRDDQVLTVMKKHGFKRTYSQLCRLLIDKTSVNVVGRRVTLNLTDDAVSTITGCLLGDGGVACSKNQLDMASFGYTSKYDDYLYYISNVCKKFGIEQCGKINTGNSINNDTWFAYNSLQYVTTLYDDWYLRDFSFCPFCEIIFHDKTMEVKEWRMTKRGRCPVCDKHSLMKKVVPRDIELTPLACMYWFVGDGSSVPSRISFATNGFLMRDIEFLRDKLIELGFESFIEDRAVLMRRDVAKRFLNYMSQCPVDYYKYKWNNIINERKKTKKVLSGLKKDTYNVINELGSASAKDILNYFVQKKRYCNVKSIYSVLYCLKKNKYIISVEHGLWCVNLEKSSV